MPTTVTRHLASPEPLDLLLSEILATLRAECAPAVVTCHSSPLTPPLTGRALVGMGVPAAVETSFSSALDGYPGAYKGA